MICKKSKKLFISLYIFLLIGGGFDSYAEKALRPNKVMRLLDTTPPTLAISPLSITINSVSLNLNLSEPGSLEYNLFQNNIIFITNGMLTFDGINPQTLILSNLDTSENYLLRIGIQDTSGNMPADSINITFTTGGVKIISDTLRLCPNDTNFLPLPSIQIIESASNDFRIANNQTLSIQAPNGVYFESDRGQVNVISGFVNIVNFEINQDSLIITYDILDTLTLDRFEIKNIGIKTTLSDTSFNLLRTGGNALQVYNNIGDNQVYSTIETEADNFNIDGSFAVCDNDLFQIYRADSLLGSSFEWFVRGGTIIGENNRRNISITWDTDSLIHQLTLNLTNQNSCNQLIESINILETTPTSTTPSQDSVSFLQPAISNFNILTSSVILEASNPDSGTGIFSGPGIVNDTVILPFILSEGRHTYTYTYTNSNGCSSSISRDLTFSNLFDVPGVDLTYCIHGDNIIIDLTQNPMNVPINAKLDSLSILNVTTNTLFIPDTIQIPDAIIIPIQQFNAGLYVLNVRYDSVGIFFDVSQNLSIENLPIADASFNIFNPDRSVTFSSLNNLPISLCDNNLEPLVFSSVSPIEIGDTNFYRSTNFPNALLSNLYYPEMAFSFAVNNIGHDPTMTLRDSIIHTFRNAAGCLNTDTLIILINGFNAPTLFFSDTETGTNDLINQVIEVCISRPDFKIFIASAPNNGTLIFDGLRNIGHVDLNPTLDTAIFNPEKAHQFAINTGRASPNNPSTHNIFYTYLDTNNCSILDTAIFIVNPLPTLFFNVPNSQISQLCFNDAPIRVRALAIRDFIDNTGTFDFSIRTQSGTLLTGAAAGLLDITSDSVSINPRILALAAGASDSISGDIQVYFRYKFTDTETGCSFLDSLQITLFTLPDLSFNSSTGNTIYCFNDAVDLITGNNMNGLLADANFTIINETTRTSNGLITTSLANEVFFEPNTASGIQNRLTQTTEHTITFTGTNQNNCDNILTRTFFINPIPFVNFENQNACSADSIFFVSLATSAAGTSIISWLWDFGDGNTSSLENPAHFYTSAGIKTVHLTVTTDQGCSNDTAINITIGTSPQIDFTANGVNVNESITFAATLFNTIGVVDSLIWDFGDGTAPIRGDTNLQMIDYIYHATGTYKITLTAISVLGCISQVIKSISFFDIVSNFPYQETFGDTTQTTHGWVTGGINSSWRLGEIENLPNNYWATNIEGAYNTNEQSYIVSPIFDFSDLENIMIAFDFFVETAESDGLVLQGTINGGITWQTVGRLNDSITWYNNSGIVTNPGNQILSQYGWSGNLASPNQLINARHGLDNFSGYPQVQFRFAFSSAQLANNNRGIILGNITIRERTRKVVFENFTNFSTPEGFIQDSIFKNIAREHRFDLIPIQYAIRFNDLDPNHPILIKKQNMSNARSFLYGINQLNTSVVGGNTQLDSPETINQNLQTLLSATLRDPVFSIGLDLQNDLLHINLTALKDLETKKLSLFILSIENPVTQNLQGLNTDTLAYSAQAFHPDITGINLQNNWIINENQILEVTINFDELEDIEETSLLVFVQDNITLEIYQAKRFQLQADNNNLVTAFESSNFLTPKKSFILFPNPTQNLIHLTFDKNLISPTWVIYNLLGIELIRGKFLTNSKKQHINLPPSPAGFYTLKVFFKSGEIESQSFIISQ